MIAGCFLFASRDFSIVRQIKIISSSSVAASVLVQDLKHCKYSYSSALVEEKVEILNETVSKKSILYRHPVYVTLQYLPSSTVTTTLDKHGRASAWISLAIQLQSDEQHTEP